MVRVLAAGRVIAQSAIADLRIATEGQVGDWRGTLYVPIDAFRMHEAGDLELQLPDGGKYRFVIVGSTFSDHVYIGGFGSPPF